MCYFDKYYAQVLNLTLRKINETESFDDKFSYSAIPFRNVKNKIRYPIKLKHFTKQMYENHQDCYNNLKLNKIPCECKLVNQDFIFTLQNSNEYTNTITIIDACELEFDEPLFSYPDKLYNVQINKK